MRTRVKRHKIVNVHGWESAGETTQQAKADAIARIEAAAQGSYAPAVICWRGTTAICWRDPVAGVWSYAVVRPGTVVDHGLSCCTSYVTKEECIDRASYHIAQNGYTQADDWRCVPRVVTDPEQRRELRHWQQWQSLHAEGVRQGMSAQQAWQHACDVQGSEVNREAFREANAADLSLDS